jgi:proline iminopeptidase
MKKTISFLVAMTHRSVWLLYVLLAGFICILSSCDILEPDTPGLLVPKTVDEDSSLPSITVNGAQLHSEAFGSPDSAMIVVLHGGPGSDYRYLLKCKDFANQGYRVVFYDQRGSGLSQRFPKSSYKSVEIMTDEVGGVIAHYRTSPTQKVFLLGHSWGAMLATAYVNEHPTAIDGLILCEPGGLIWQDVMDYVGRTRDFGITSEPLNDAMYADQFFTGSEDDHIILDYKFALMGGSDDNVGNEELLPIWRMGAVINRALIELGNKEKPNWTTNLHQYTTKILFVYSERNEAYGYDHAVKVSSVYPNVQLFKTNGAGHDMLSFDTGWNNTYPTMLTYLNNLK